MRIGISCLGLFSSLFTRFAVVNGFFSNIEVVV